MIHGAGIMFLANGQALFLKRGHGGDFPGYWGFPGGSQETGESLEQTAIRECVEEIGFLPDGERAVLARNIADRGLISGVITPDTAAPPERPGEQVDFTTFVQRVNERFDPTLNGEHTGFAWALSSEPPEPLHPGARIALARLTMDELGIARAMAAGDLTSPQRYGNVTLFAIRITGTGTAYRSSLNEYCYRPPDKFLNDEFLARCNGLPVIFEHPKGATLNSKEFNDRMIGTIFVPYIKGNEVWGIAKIYDDEAIELMLQEKLSTSPTVMVRPADSTTMTMEDGSALLIEGNPYQLDHVAICELGVWDKGGPPAGVESETNGAIFMTEEEMKAKADAEAKEKADRAKADADAGQKLDNLLSCVDAMSKRMDAFDEDRKADKARKDGENMPGDPVKLAADKARKDAEEKEEEDRKADKARKDAEEEEKTKAKADAEDLRQKLADMEGKMPKELSDSDYATMADAQARADEVAQAFGDQAPRPLSGESPLAYRKRLAGKFKSNSAAWKEVDLSLLPDAAFGIAETQIYADALQVAKSPVTVPPGELRKVQRRLDSGHVVNEYIGQPSAWMNDIAGPTRQYVTAFKTSTSNGSVH